MSGPRPGCTPTSTPERVAVGRPRLIAEIADWWHERLALHEQSSGTPDGRDIEAVTARFACSTDEAIRGICVGEQRYWGNS